ncbi:hypothetical protein M422DRAFT_269215 [Sphaerobolus stellatus SS14]|uniref:Uncharacterized protein n=1 Tax=Sphaerobolus stellatus (strain SS14) TaxID=990650 RepID=A0A0C9TIM1_SPHS4|nr:hypothetical protein M422DRAFT_269215 [Sphaerobolus stellatus SS14]
MNITSFKETQSAKPCLLGVESSRSHLAPGRQLTAEAEVMGWTANGKQKMGERDQMTMPTMTPKDTSYVLVPHVDVRIEPINVHRSLPKKDEQVVPDYIEVEWGRYRWNNVDMAGEYGTITPLVSRMREEECILRLERSIQRQDDQFEEGYITFELTWPGLHYKC